MPFRNNLRVLIAAIIQTAKTGPRWVISGNGQEPGKIAAYYGRSDEQTPGGIRVDNSALNPSIIVEPSLITGGKRGNLQLISSDPAQANPSVAHLYGGDNVELSADAAATVSTSFSNMFIQNTAIELSVQNASIVSVTNTAVTLHKALVMDASNIFVGATNIQQGKRYYTREYNATDGYGYEIQEYVLTGSNPGAITVLNRDEGLGMTQKSYILQTPNGRVLVVESGVATRAMPTVASGSIAVASLAAGASRTILLTFAATGFFRDVARLNVLTSVTDSRLSVAITNLTLVDCNVTFTNYTTVASAAATLRYTAIEQVT